MKKPSKVFLGINIFIIAICFLYYIGNTIFHIILDYKEKNELPSISFGNISVVFEGLYGKATIAFMVITILILVTFALIIALLYRTHISKWTFALEIIGFLLPIAYMDIWLKNISNGLYHAPSPILWLIIFTVYLIISVMRSIKDIRKIGNE